MTTDDIAILNARQEDAGELNDLYFSVYGSDYPLKKGIEYQATFEALRSPDRHYWLVARSGSGKIVGSCIFEKDPDLRIGKVSGVVVHKEFRGKGLSKALITAGTEHLLQKDKSLHSLYTTTRTVSVAPQLMFLGNGYTPLGVFPNAHKLRRFETVTLMGAFSKDTLKRRAKVRKMHMDVARLAETVNKNLGMRDFDAKMVSFPDAVLRGAEGSAPEFEFIFAPGFVERCFRRKFRRLSEAGF